MLRAFKNNIFIKNEPKKKKQIAQSEVGLYFMICPAVILILIFSYLPMYGIKIAFLDFNPAIGLFGKQKFIGLQNFKVAFSSRYAIRGFRNTLIIASIKLFSNLTVPIIFSLLLNEIRSSKFKRMVQTAIYLPHFISWVILGTIFVQLLSVEFGMVNIVLRNLGLQQVSFLGSNKYFRGTIIGTHIWKEFGYGTIMYLAAITNIDTELYEAADADGAGRFIKMWYITIPGLSMVIILRMVLSLSSILNAGFDQIFNLYNDGVYEVGDILETYIYRLGLINLQYGQSTATGLLKSVISLILISTSYISAYKLFDYKVF